MNVSAPTSVPDLAGLVLWLAAPLDAAVPFPGFAPPGFLTAGAGTLHSFQSTLADLLPVEGEPEQKPEEDDKQREARSVIPGVTIPAQAAVTTPFAGAIALLQGRVLAQPAPAAKAEPGEAPFQNLYAEPALEVEPMALATPPGLVLPQLVPASDAGPVEMPEHDLRAEPANQPPPIALTIPEPAPAAKMEPGRNPVRKRGFEPATEVQPIAVPVQASKPKPFSQRKIVASVPATPTAFDPAKAEAPGNAGVPPVSAFAPPSPSPLVPRPEMVPGGRPEPLPAASDPGAGTAPEDRRVPELPNLAFVERFTYVTRPPEGRTPGPPVAMSAAQPRPSPEAISSHPGDGAPGAAKDAVDGAPLAPAAGIEDRASDHRHGNEERRRVFSEQAPPKSGAEPAEQSPARVEEPRLQPAAPLSAPAKEVGAASPAAAAPKPAETPHAEPEPDRLPTAPQTHAGEAHSISLRVTDATEQRVELKIKDQGGELRVTVRTADADLSGALRENLGDLVHKLEQSGFRAETWHPAQAGSPDSRFQDSRSEGESPDHSGRQQQDSGDGRQRRQQPPRNDDWEEIENSFAPDSERSTPTWLPA